jgi:hypothetical protein
MEITPYNHHRRLLSPQRLWSSNQDYRVNRAFALIQSISRVLCEKWEPQKPTPYAVVVALTVNVTRPNEHPITFSKRIAGRQVAPVYLDLDARTEDNSLSSNSSLKIEYRDAKSFMSNNLRHQSGNFCPDRNIRTDSK